MTDAASLLSVFDGWGGHNLALVRALAPLSSVQLGFQPAANLRSVGEMGLHIADGRLSWWRRMLGDEDEAVQLALSRRPLEPMQEDAGLLVEWLDQTWRMVESTLTGWTVHDLQRDFRQDYQGKTWLVPFQWVVFRILAHDLHHGGEVALALGIQGIAVPELGDEGGHLTELREA